MIEDESLEEIFGPQGVLASHLTNYEFRASQLSMARAVLKAINTQEHLLVEAGTGTGKTLSYLIPALLSRRRTLISTATKNLQEQIYYKDLPFVESHLFPGLESSYMKGRQNYLCLRRFQGQTGQLSMLDTGTSTVQERLAEWVPKTETGDRAELGWLSDNDPVWDSLDARSDACTGQKCPFFDDCFVTRMRKRAMESDVIVVNHALFFSNLALQSDEIGRVLPDFSVLVLDEAHEVEEVAANHFGQRLSSFQIEDLCRQVWKSFQKEDDGLLSFVERLEASAHQFFFSFPGQQGRYSLNLYPAGSGLGVVDLRLELARGADDVMDRLHALYHTLELNRSKSEETDLLIRRVERYIDILENIFNLDSPDYVYWFERSARGVVVNLTPIDIASLLREGLFTQIDSSILTSATLTTAGSFDYMKERLGLPEPMEVTVPGEFDYRSQAAVYLPRGLPEPRTTDHFEHLLHHIHGILRLTDGHAFLLFTSVRQMQRVYETLHELAEYPVMCQGTMPKSRLLEQFRATPRSVLCATSSFWQGVDVQGDALRAVVIDKLPFHVPSEPLVAARMDRLTRQGRDPFLGYTVPSAIISLRQGLGRLIRSRRDTGLMAVLDSRIWSKRYGKLFLNSLPNCPIADNMKDLENFFRQIVSSQLGGG